MAEDTIDLPQVGPVKKTYVTIGLAVAVGIVGYAYYKHHQSSSALQQTGANAQYAVDQASMPGSTASGSTVDSTVNTSLAGQLPTNNGEWMDAAREKATEVGIDVTALTAALGKWMAHQTLTQDEANLVNQARALVGEDPPNGGPYPVNITSTTSGSGSKPAIPHLAFQSGTANAHGFTLKATPVAGATQYQWRVGVRGLPQAPTATTSEPIFTFQSAQRGKEYWANVQAINANGASGGSNMLTGLYTYPR